MYTLYIANIIYARVIFPKYWLFKQMDLSYQNFNRMVMNETRSIRFENLDALSNILNCPIGDLFEKTSEPDD